MNNKLYESLMSNISYTISGILNENNIDTEERQMYEQDKFDNETWKQMADRVGFTDWYQQMGLQSKNIGDTYAKRRQRWLANNCKDTQIIHNEIENLEDCIEFAYLGDDNYINVPVKNDRNNKISELEQEIKDLKNRLLILSNKIDNSDAFNAGCLDVNKMDPDMLTNPESLDFSGYSDSFKRESVSMLNNLKSRLKDFKEEYRRECRQNKHKYKYLVISDEGIDDTYVGCDVAETEINKKFHTDCKGDDIYYINIGLRWGEHNLLKMNASRFKVLIKSICPTLDMHICDKEVRNKYNRWDYGKEFYFFYMKLV